MPPNPTSWTFKSVAYSHDFITQCKQKIVISKSKVLTHQKVVMIRTEDQKLHSGNKNKEQPRMNNVLVLKTSLCKSFFHLLYWIFYLIKVWGLKLTWWLKWAQTLRWIHTTFSWVTFINSTLTMDYTLWCFIPQSILNSYSHHIAKILSCLQHLISWHIYIYFFLQQMWSKLKNLPHLPYKKQSLTEVPSQWSCKWGQIKMEWLNTAVTHKSTREMH